MAELAYYDYQSFRPETIADESITPELIDAMKEQSKFLIHEYYRTSHKIDHIVHSLTSDEESVFRTRHQKFVESLATDVLVIGYNSPTDVGQIFAQLLSRNILSMKNFTQGIGAVLNDWPVFNLRYPPFFYFIGGIMAQIILTKTASLSDLQDAYRSICSYTTGESFSELLKYITTLDDAAQIKTLLGKMFLTAIIHEELVKLEGDNIIPTMYIWIKKRLSKNITRFPEFIWSLAAAVFFVSMTRHYTFVGDFFDKEHRSLLHLFIPSAEYHYSFKSQILDAFTSLLPIHIVDRLQYNVILESLDLFGEVAGNTHYLPFVGNIVQEIRDRRKRSHFYVSHFHGHMEQNYTADMTKDYNLIISASYSESWYRIKEKLCSYSNITSYNNELLNHYLYTVDCIYLKPETN